MRSTLAVVNETGLPRFGKVVRRSIVATEYEEKGLQA